MTDDDAIAILNGLVKIRIAPSKIHGVGVFAMRDIEKGTKLYATMFPQVYKIPYEEMKRLFPEVRQLLLERWPQIVNGSSFMWPDTNSQAYMNHSDTPNYSAQDDVTLEDIYKGDEITEDYRKIDNWGKVFPWLSLDN